MHESLADLSLDVRRTPTGLVLSPPGSFPAFQVLAGNDPHLL